MRRRRRSVRLGSADRHPCRRCSARGFLDSTMRRRVLMLVNRDKPDSADVAASVRTIIETHGLLAGELDAVPEDGSPETNGAELIAVLGGDGTMLSQTRRCASLGLPMLGVNIGKVGFTAEFDVESLSDQAASLFGGGAPLPLREVAILEIAVNGEAVGLAMNECVVTAGPPFRMIELSLRIDGEPGPTVAGDGMIVSTPVGSTAYTLSAGGPILSPSVYAMAITPIAAHSLSFRPIVVPGESVVELRVGRVNRDGPGCEGGTAVVLDGRVAKLLNAGDVVRVRRHATSARFVTNAGASYWSTLIRKLHWAVQPLERKPSGDGGLS
ncbi:MAG: NAD(+)/NADH kinase [Phycisphaerales bacterium]|nr:MAG: NAD(+)/NADH kinase [Phycisphaerales bacterium]